MRDVLAAFVAAIDAGSAAPVYKGQAPNGPPAGYMVVTPSTPRPGDYSTAATTVSRRWRFVVLYVGNSADSALFRAEEAETALLGNRLTVTGLNCSPLRRESGRPIERDPDVENVFSGADVWTFTTTPA